MRPGGPGWRRVAALAGEPQPAKLGTLVVDWIAGWILIYAMLFGIGALVMGSPLTALPYAAVAVAAIIVIVVTAPFGNV